MKLKTISQTILDKRFLLMTRSFLLREPCGNYKPETTIDEIEKKKKNKFFIQHFFVIEERTREGFKWIDPKTWSFLMGSRSIPVLLF